MSKTQSWSLAVLSAVAWLTITGCSQSAAPSTASTAPGDANSADSGPVARRATPVPPNQSDAFFARTEIVTLTLEISPRERALLAQNQREYVPCRLREHGGETWQSASVKLKGAAGSFRELEDKPAFTLKMDKYRKKRSFHGLAKFHLNNSVQDETYLHEWLCAGLFRDAGVPAARVTHARVFLDDRDLGLYVLKEGYDRKFIARHFASDQGNLYDGGFCQDIDADLERDAGQGDDDHADQHRLCAACQTPESEARWGRMAEVLDIDAFLTFAAMELMTCHWDGYCQQKNNYRLYFDAASHQGHFLPHGMDQMFGDPGASILDRPGAIVAAAVMENPEWRSRFRDRIRRLLPLFNPPARLLEQIDQREGRIRSALELIDPEEAQSYAVKIQELKERLTIRAESLLAQSESPDPPPPQPLKFSGEEGIEIVDWQPTSESEDANLEYVELADNRSAYQIQCGTSGACVASWRKTVLLSRGEFRLAVSAATTDVASLKDEKGAGAGVRISGSHRDAGLEATSGWQLLEFHFSVTEDEQEVTLVAELRATAGSVQFDAQAMRLYRIPEN